MATNYFTAPVRGLYWFTASIYTGFGRLLLEVNNDMIVAARTGDSDDDPSGAAMSVMVLLEIGHQVACFKESGVDYFLGSVDGYYQNVFSGFSVHGALS